MATRSSLLNRTPTSVTPARTRRRRPRWPASTPTVRSSS
ncbi:hypothetical protein DIJ69_06295 [Streptomyces globisporus]|nr:hypothetical protein DIJ69_06295 [Streptomyces globisporus]